jgi:hypothetical protein
MTEGTVVMLTEILDMPDVNEILEQLVRSRRLEGAANELEPVCSESEIQVDTSLERWLQSGLWNRFRSGSEPS